MASLNEDFFGRRWQRSLKDASRSTSWERDWVAWNEWNDGSCCWQVDMWMFFKKCRIIFADYIYICYAIFIFLHMFNVNKGSVVPKMSEQMRWCAAPKLKSHQLIGMVYQFSLSFKQPLFRGRFAEQPFFRTPPPQPPRGIQGSLICCLFFESKT